MTSSRQMVITLFVVALVCSVVLSYVYSYTAPRIEETQNELMRAGLEQVIAAQRFDPVIPDTLWRALDSEGQMKGLVFRVFPQGYGGPIPITVGIDLEGLITGIKIATSAEGLVETPGLGAKIVEKSFTDQFVGRCLAEVQLTKDGGKIDGITAATISSRAVCNGVQNGIKKYGEYAKAAIDKRCVFETADRFAEIIEDSLWYALANDETLGIVFTGKAEGYADRIEFIVGVDRDGKITGVDILYSNETPGIGDMIEDRKFLDQFERGMPDAITGATVSSQSLINAVDALLERYQEFIE
jgi:electron transport complex protein RnfG